MAEIKIPPIPLFSTFTASQAILEAIDGSNFVYIIDFDIGFGGHWASLMKEIVDKQPAGSGGDQAKSSNSIVLRITTIVPEEFGVESQLVRGNLAQFARDLNITFHLEFVLIQILPTPSLCIILHSTEQGTNHKMPLGERPGDKSESLYCGVETDFSDDMPHLLSFNINGGFDFVVTPVVSI